MPEKKTGNHIYYNINIPHDPAYGNAPSPATYTATKNQAILDRASSYHMACIRFTLPGSTLPILICEIQEGSAQTNANLTPYSVTLSYGGSDFQTFLIYTPQNNLPVPSAPSANAPSYTQTVTPYYFIYTYQAFLDMINTALATSFTTLKGFFPAAPQTEAPYFIYDATTQLISLITQYSYSQGGAIEIYVNTNLLTYVEGIEVFFLGNNQANGKDFRYVVEDKGNNAYFKQLPTAAPPATADYLIFTAEGNFLPLWNSFRNIVFVATVMPLQGEYLSNKGASNDNVSSISIMTDFEPLQQLGADIRQNFQFYVQGQYRWTDLISDDPLTKFSLNIYWQDKKLNLYPMTIPINQSATIKLLFERREIEM